MLLVPDFDYLRSELNLKEEDEALPALPEVISFYERILAGINADLAPFEQPKKFRLLPRDFELTDGEITPTMKIRRGVIEKRYQETIEGMYTD